MKILVTGADGFLGSAVVRSLRAVGWEVVPVTRRTNAAEGAVYCDLADPAAVCRMVADTAPDCTVHTAAMADFSPGVLPALYSVNVLATAILANDCRKRDAHFVFASMAIHGRQSAYFGPEVPVLPETDYGITKLLSEQLIKASGCRAAIIRFGGIFGETGPEHLGINRAIRRSRMGRVPAVTGTGIAKRNYVSVEDAARGVAACIAGRLTGTFYSGGQALTILEMVQSICDVWLPGQRPEMVPGDDACDQLVHVSPELGPVRSFREALDASR